MSDLPPQQLPTGGSPHPWQQPAHHEPTPAASTTKAVLIALAAVFLVFLLICGGIVGFGWYAINRFEEQIIAEMAAIDEDPLTEEALLEAIADDPTLQQQIGEIREVRYDGGKTSQATNEDDWYFWYVVEGTKGSASVRALEPDDGERWFDSVELEKPDGTLVPLELKAVPYYEWPGERDVIEWVEQDPELQPLVGTVRALRADDERTAEETEPEEPAYWYVIEGDAGSLPVLVTFDEEDSWFETVERAEVEMPDGTRREVGPEAGEPPSETKAPSESEPL